MATKTAQPEYSPETWSQSQRDMHTPRTLDEAFHSASCLAGGWYRRTVTIDMKIVDRDEFYMIRPSDAAPADGWEPIYSVTAHSR